jgi:flagellar protein FliO/FliZ
LGGEKLKTILPILRYCAPAFCVLILLTILTSAMFAQEQDAFSVPGDNQTTVSDTAPANAAADTGGAVNPESLIVLGEPVPGLPAPRRTASMALMFRMLLILLVAALAIYGVVYFIKKAAKAPVQNDPYLKVLSSVHLGSNRYVHVVSISGKAWLIGSADSGVNLISEITDENTVNAMLEDESRRSAENSGGRFPDFKTLLHNLGINAGNQAPPADNIRKRRERLKGL